MNCPYCNSTDIKTIDNEYHCNSCDNVILEYDLVGLQELDNYEE